VVICAISFDSAKFGAELGERKCPTQRKRDERSQKYPRRILRDENPKDPRYTDEEKGNKWDRRKERSPRIRRTTVFEVTDVACGNLVEKTKGRLVQPSEI
jgi:hypothetical protein